MNFGIFLTSLFLAMSIIQASEPKTGPKLSQNIAFSEDAVAGCKKIILGPASATKIKEAIDTLHLLPGELISLVAAYSFERGMILPVTPNAKEPWKNEFYIVDIQNNIPNILRCVFSADTSLQPLPPHLKTPEIEEDLMVLGLIKKDKSCKISLSNRYSPDQYLAPLSDVSGTTACHMELFSYDKIELYPADSQKVFEGQKSSEYYLRPGISFADFFTAWENLARVEVPQHSSQDSVLKMLAIKSINIIAKKFPRRAAQQICADPTGTLTPVFYPARPQNQGAGRNPHSRNITTLATRHSRRERNSMINRR